MYSLEVASRQCSGPLSIVEWFLRLRSGPGLETSPANDVRMRRNMASPCWFGLTAMPSTLPFSCVPRTLAGSSVATSPSRPLLSARQRIEKEAGSSRFEGAAAASDASRVAVTVVKSMVVYTVVGWLEGAEVEQAGRYIVEDEDEDGDGDERGSADCAGAEARTTGRWSLAAVIGEQAAQARGARHAARGSGLATPTGARHARWQQVSP